MQPNPTPAVASYYAGVNPDLLDRIPLSSTHVLEIGCGAGRLAAAYRARNPQARLWGVETHGPAAAEAAARLDHLIEGDIEDPATLARLDAARQGTLFNALIFGDVLEHLRDPWRTLADLRARMAPDAVCCICVPNVAHWSLLAGQLRGAWTYTESGLLDRTHLRFFTRDSAGAMLAEAGWAPADSHPRVLWPQRTREALAAFAGVAATLRIPPGQAAANLSAFQWVIRATNGPAPPLLRVVALGLPKQAGVTEARVDHPLHALNSLPGVRAGWGPEAAQSLAAGPPGILLLHRRFLADPRTTALVEAAIAKGWVAVHDFDDDPDHWPQFRASDYRGFRAVHALTASTEPLAAKLRAWNPNVRVFPNAVPELPPLAANLPKQGPRLRIFFGALNREADWAPIIDGIQHAARQLADKVEFLVVHDRAFFDALPPSPANRFRPTLAYPAYAEALRGCDIALLPLADTPFNRMKSDLKLVECLAAGVVPVCSPTVYATDTAHHGLALFARTAAEWAAALIALCNAPSRIAALRAKGVEHVARHRLHAHQAAPRAAHFRALLAARPALEQARRQRLAHHETAPAAPAR